MADRIGVIRHGELILVENKANLMQQLGRRQLSLQLLEPLQALPAGLADWPLVLGAAGGELHYSFEEGEERTGIASLLRRLAELGIGFRDLHTHQSSLEEIFVRLVSERRSGGP